MVALVIEIDIIISHITSLPQWATAQFVKLDAMGDAIIDLQGQSEWVTKTNFTLQIFDIGESLDSIRGTFCVETNHQKNEELTPSQRPGSCLTLVLTRTVYYG